MQVITTADIAANSFSADAVPEVLYYKDRTVFDNKTVLFINKNFEATLYKKIENNVLRATGSASGEQKKDDDA